MRVPTTLRLLSACIGLFAAFSDTAAETLRGRVLSDAGDPVIATVRVLPDSVPLDGVPLVGVTTEDGTFEIPNVGGALRVRIESRGWAPATVTHGRLEEALEVTLRPGSKLRGRVTDAFTGEGVASATVWICDEAALAFGFDACMEHEADEFGRFAVGGIPQGALKLGAASARHAFRTIEVTDPGIEEIYRLALDNGVPLSGRVVNDRGEPVGGVRIGRDEHPFPFDTRTSPALDPPLITDANGDFRHPGLPRGRVFLRGLRTGWYGAASGMIAPVPGEPLEVELQVAPAAALQFGLVDDDGEPVEVPVRLIHEDYGRASGLRGRAGEDRRYYFERMPTKPLELTLAVEGYQSIDLGEVGLGAGRTVDLGDLRVTRGVTLTGSLLDTFGEPIESGAIELHYDEPANFVQRIETASGQYRFEGVPPGVEITLRCSAEGYASLVDVLTLDEDTDWDPVLEPRAGVRGRVIDPDGNPVSDFSVLASSEEKEWATRQAESFEATDGTFFLWPVEPPGTHTFEIVAKGYRGVALNGIVVEARQVVDLGDITLSSGMIIEGTTTGSDGTPASGARVTVMSRSLVRGGLMSASEDRQASISDDEGRFAISGLPPGYFRVQALHPDFAPWFGELEIVEGSAIPSLDIDFSEGGIVHGAVLDRAGAPANDVPMRVSCSEQLLDRAGQTDEHGYYRLTRLPGGQCRVTAFAVRGATSGKTKSVAVIAGRESRVDFDLSSVITVSGTLRVGGQVLSRGGLVFNATDEFPGVSSAMALTDPVDGSYSVELTEPGEYRVKVEVGNVRTFERLLVPDVPELVHDFDLPLNGIRGRVIDTSGNPVSDIEITGTNARVGLLQMMRSSSMSAPDGSFELKHLEPGTYVVTAVGDGYIPARSRTLELRADTVVEGLELVLERSTQRIRGRFVDPRGGGLGGGLVFAAPAGERRIEFATQATTGPDGAFDLDLPAEGAVDITGLARGWAAARLASVVPDGETELTLRAVFGGRLAVSVNGGDGTPREGVTLEVRADPEWLASRVQRMLRPPPISGPDGVAVVDGLAEGTYRVAVKGVSVLVAVQEGQTATASLVVD